MPTGAMHNGIPISAQKKRFDSVFVAHIGAKKLAIGGVLQFERAFFVVRKVGANEKTCVFQLGNQRRTQKASRACHENFFCQIGLSIEKFQINTQKMLWLNGELVETAQIDATSAAVSLGWGVFSTLGVRDGATLWTKKHLARLNRDAQLCGIENPFGDAQIETGLRATIEVNRIENGLARLTLTRRGDGRWNTQTGSDFSILALETEVFETPLRVGVGFHPHGRHHPFRGAKTTSYLPFLELGNQAQNAGFDEVLLFNDAQILVETARSTPFWAKGGELFTPSLQLGGLRGVGREIVLDWAAINGFLVREGAFGLEELVGVGEMFLMSGASGPRSVGHLVLERKLGFASGEFCPRIRAFWRAGE